MLPSPKSHEIISVYLAHTDEVVSLVLFINQTTKANYFLSKKVAGVKLRYLSLHKVALALVHSARILLYYF